MQADTKTKLLDIAENAARRRGFDGFSYADLADAAGIRKASIHYHFATKAVLSAALMDRYYTAVQQVCADIDATYDRGSDRLSAIVDFYRDALGGGETICLCVSFTISRASLADDVRERMVKFRSIMSSWLTRVFDLGVADGSIANVDDTQSKAHATLAMLEGAHLAAHAENDIAAFDRSTLSLLRENVSATAP